MANHHAGKARNSSQFLKGGGRWATGGNDRHTPDVQKNIAVARQMQQQIKQQKEISLESLKRIVKL